MADSIVVKRLVRCLRYRQTYIKIFESFLQPKLHPVVVRLLHTLMSAQQTAATSLSGYLQDLGIATQDLPLDQRLLAHASSRNDTRSRLRFVYYGLSRSSSWYKTQLTDKQMTAEPELGELLLDLGQMESAKLWRVEAVMAMLRIPVQPRPDDQHELRRAGLQQAHDWRSGLAQSTGRPAWKGRQSTTQARPFRRDRYG